MSFIARLKKIFIGLFIAAALCFAFIPQLRADVTPVDSNALLAQIAQYTNGTLNALTAAVTLPSGEQSTVSITSIISAALTNLTATDTATNPPSPTPTMQNGFTTYVSDAATSTTQQTALQQQLLSQLFANFTTTTVPYANDLAFTNLYGVATPFFNPDPRKNPPADPALTYLSYASGMQLSHAVPSSTWTGSAPDQIRYSQFFGTAYSIQSFNAYIMSQLYEDFKAGVPAAQTTLINQASDPTNWFATITNESIGAVLRQTLMYQSQSYIVLTQLLQTEKNAASCYGDK